MQILTNNQTTMENAAAFGLRPAAGLIGKQTTNHHDKGSSINYVVSGGEGGSKIPDLLSKKTTKRGGRGSKIADFRLRPTADHIVKKTTNHHDKGPSLYYVSIFF